MPWLAVVPSCYPRYCSVSGFRASKSDWSVVGSTTGLKHGPRPQGSSAQVPGIIMIASDGWMGRETCKWIGLILGV